MAPTAWRRKPGGALKDLSTIPLAFFLARKKEAVRPPAPMESGHTPFFISLLDQGLSTTLDHFLPKGSIFPPNFA